MTDKPERLESKDTSAALSVLREAFATHPMLPPDTPPKTTQRLMKLMVDTFGCDEAAGLHGIRRDETLVCVALTLPNGAEPKGLVLVSFIVRLCFILGFSLIRDFTRAMENQPKFDKPYLDLMLLATLPTHHAQGLGRTMLRFIYDMAESQGYHGVTLAVAKDTPPHALYRKEGFMDVSETSMRNLTLCYMRRDNRPAS